MALKEKSARIDELDRLLNDARNAKENSRGFISKHFAKKQINEYESALIEAYKDYNYEYSKILKGEWEIPYAKVREECDNCNIISLEKREDYMRFKYIVEKIVVEENFSDLYLYRICMTSDKKLKEIFAEVQKIRPIDKWYLLDLLKDDYDYTISTIVEMDEELKKLGASKISRMVRQLITDGYVKREEIKRVAYFSKTGKTKE